MLSLPFVSGAVSLFEDWRAAFRDIFEAKKGRSQQKKNLSTLFSNIPGYKKSIKKGSTSVAFAVRIRNASIILLNFMELIKSVSKSYMKMS